MARRATRKPSILRGRMPPPKDSLTPPGSRRPASTLSSKFPFKPATSRPYRSGDFSAAIPAAGSRVLGTDSLGRPQIANTIYDPNTARTVNGQLVTDPFSGNRIDPARFDPVALKIQSAIPLPNLSGLF